MRPSSGRRIVGVALLAGALLAQGCSLTRTRAPPDPYVPTQPPACTADRDPPFMDAGISLLAVVLVIALAATPAQEGRDHTGAIVAGSAAAVGFGASSWLGYHRAFKCGAAWKVWRAEQEKHAAAERAAQAARRAQPLHPATLELLNGPADLRVTVTASLPDTNEEFVVLREHRIGLGQTQTLGEVLQGRDGMRAVFTVKVLIRGQWSEAGTVDTRFRANGLLRLRIERDPATARARVSGSWAE